MEGSLGAMKFVKMHGIGNDYVYVDCFSQAVPPDPAELSRRVSRQHFGVGSDGLILMLPDEGADARMRIFNIDGSEGEMCGNGIRCMAKYLYDAGVVKKERMRIATGAGVRTIDVITEGGVCVGARVDMGSPVFEPGRIPVNAADNRVEIAFPDGKAARFTCLNVGNPHAVTLDRFPENDAQFFADGPFAENHPLFPARANISFCRAEDATHLTARIWERGSGPTLACGSGATATLVAAHLAGACGPRAHVALPGGTLYIEFDRQAGRVFMTGPATTVFTGEWNDNSFQGSNT